MKKAQTLLRVALGALPAIGCGVALSFFRVADRADLRTILAYTVALAALTLLLAVEVFWFYYAYYRHRPTLKRVGHERDFLKRRATFLESRLSLLEDDVEMLSAMRQVARAAASHEGLDRVLDDTLRIVQELVCADWVTVFVTDDKTGALVARAHRRGGESHTGKAIPPGMIDDTNVSQAYRYGSMIKEAEGGRLLAAVPVTFGGTKLGVVAVSAPLSGTADEKAQKVEVFESALKDIAQHIAYALRAMKLETAASEDDLTGLGDRGLFDQRLSEMTALALRKNQPLSLVLLDIDHFKNVNDAYGHQAGDEILRDVAEVLKKNLRKYDTAYRYGGEELALILPQTALGDAVKLCERIRVRLEKRAFLGRKAQVTASFGVAALGGPNLTESSLVAAADAALYRAKSNGRNRVEGAGMPASP